ncbi:hypothetical protein [Rhizobium rhizogenes]|uniref:hypothetical protein n=1 Tax=Rhizobium rhizogenes TaxID=359 RepID=UPI0004D99232|nr:hypothetical protein [Rhizobium rhizogenes]KEA07135.1 hypothetical protein CN09_09305 [Rhizobium rhizogenes]NTI80432.1 hypothetical protein [Rhizobium rhizogenes]NTJ22618.1 hypothetical protein [Rhizobium rhizogenes]QUE81322.1 hypothetical protein EML492_05815 [Rhizobium rhizogenes]TQO80580.1 hypothetical protein FFE80_05620 [Rhizobium rhizogenes]
MNHASPLFANIPTFSPHPIVRREIYFDTLEEFEFIKNAAVNARIINDGWIVEKFENRSTHPHLVFGSAISRKL